MIFAISDVHGRYDRLTERIGQLIPWLEEDSKLILLGDYIDGGENSFQCLNAVYELERKYGTDQVVVLKGNHEAWFEEFLFENDDCWLTNDINFATVLTFLTEEQVSALTCAANSSAQAEYVRRCIKEEHNTLVLWMRELRLYYETDSQIFVHAGVDEDILEEEVEWCAIATPDDVKLEKYPPARGSFYKDIIAGHVTTAQIARDSEYGDVFYDGESHFYIDGSGNKIQRLLCLAYDEKNGNYYEYHEDGSFRELIKAG